MADKLTKQELKQPDKLQIMFAEVMDYLSQHKKEMTIGVSAVILVLLVVTGWYFYRQNEEKTALTLYNKATEEYFVARATGKDPSAAIKRYEEIETKYSGTQAAAFATYRLGNLSLNLNNVDAAMKWYQKYLNHDSSDNEFKALVLNGLGYCYEIKKDYKNALVYFEKAASSKTGASFVGLTHENIGRMHESLNDPKKALDSYKKALEKTVDPGMKELLNRKISTLG